MFAMGHIEARALLGEQDCEFDFPLSGEFGAIETAALVGNLRNF